MVFTIPRRAVASALLSAVCLIAAPGLCHARPIELEDVLNQEDFGAVTLTGGWAVVEQRGPYAAAPRFDYFLANNLFRTRIMVADLAHFGPLHPLFRHEPGVGYQAGPPSPDGKRLAVFRLKRDRWQLGVATLATGAVRWLDVTPNFALEERVVQWTSPTRLVVIARQDEPYELRWVRPAAPLPARWALTARGGTAVTVVGSGREIGVRPQALPRRVLEVSATTGRARTLARGVFTDLELSASGRWLAVLEAGEDIPLTADHAVQGPYGIAVQRTRLVLIDRASGRVSRPCPRCDVLAGLLSWSPAGDELLAYVRDDGTPWTSGRLVRIEAASGVTRLAAPGLAPVIERRPEVVYAGWMGADPIVLARSAPGNRPDWYRIGRSGAVNLTRELKEPPHAGLVTSAKALLLAGDGAAWRITPEGDAARLTENPFSILPSRRDRVPGRAALAPRPGEPLVGVVHQTAGDQVLRTTVDGVRTAPLRLTSADRLLAAEPAGVLALRTRGGGQQDLEWVSGSTTRTLAWINRRFATIDIPKAVPVTHAGPNGEALTSWVLLPPQGADPRHPPPLIVALYLGYTYPSSPAAELVLTVPGEAEALLASHGYAVLVPSLAIRKPSNGPADRLAEQVLAIVDKAAAQPDLAGAFDPTRLGLWGHSFGAYSTLAVITQTDRFKAAVAQSSQSDLISMHGTFIGGGAIYADEGVSTPFSAGWTEDLQGDMRAPPFADPDRYVRNSPVLQAGHIHTPLMLMHGDLDNMSLGQAQEMFSALYRQNKDAVLVTYWGEPHIFQSPGTLRDIYARMFDWYDSQLLTAPTAAEAPSRSPGSASASDAPRPPAPRP